MAGLDQNLHRPLCSSQCAGEIVYASAGHNCIDAPSLQPCFGKVRGELIEVSRYD